MSFPERTETGPQRREGGNKKNVTYDITSMNVLCDQSGKGQSISLHSVKMIYISSKRSQAIIS